MDGVDKEDHVEGDLMMLKLKDMNYKTMKVLKMWQGNMKKGATQDRSGSQTKQ